ncbi:MAG: carboxypeptidase M32 [Neomegalonema sp.]|nr:carboxypeptidase M32 [Neomegalonema sp.]
MTNTHLDQAAAAMSALEAQFSRQWAFGEACGILGWDKQTMMPNGAADARGDTMAALVGAQHELMLDPRMSDWFAAAESVSAPADDDEDALWRQANLREMRRAWRDAVALPTALVEALSKATTAAEMAWRTARAESNFAALKPHLEEVLRLTREQAAAKAEQLGVSLYDALLDQFEPGARGERIEAHFSALSAFLPDFLDDVLTRQGQAAPAPDLGGPFDDTAQKALCEAMMKAVGFDFDRGRLDVSLHPFCGGATDDVRITTRYDANDPLKGFFGVLHETGHALYQQGLPARWRMQPVGGPRGLVLHESQSLLLEMQVARSPEFLRFAAPIMATSLGRAPTDPAFAPEAIRQRAHKVERGMIRVDADEVSYPAHVILRTRLERAMVHDDLQIADLPGAWNDGMKELLGVVPANDAEGCLQDIHWPSGGWGYFPTYTLGAMAAAQLFEAALAAAPQLPDQLREGDLSALVAWLRANVHGKASLQTTDQILTAATGAPLGADAFMRRLRARYGR